MPYNPNIPQPNDQLSVSQGDILQNFQALAPVGAGYLLLELLGADPATGAAQEAIYSRTGPISGQQELFLKRNAGSTYPVAAQNFTFTEAGMTRPGWTRMPSGILLKWGFQAGIGAVAVPINLDLIGPLYSAAVASNPFTVTLAPGAGTPLPVFVVSLNNSTLNLVSTGAGASAFWLTVGV